MLSSRYRFHGYGSLNYTYRNGKTVRSSHFALKYCLNKRRKNSRVAVVVSKKVAKKAVLRNQIRRRMFEAIRLELIDPKEPHDMIFTVFDDSLATSDFLTIRKDVKQLLNKANIC